ncbi:MAG: hypothetical protein M3383_07215 [Actinomycetota bacterium]|nr:hypothetical protein [Actinomycetota bacterium]
MATRASATNAPPPIREAAPEVALGRTHRDGIGASIYALIERGVARRPDIARQLQGKLVIRFREPYIPTRVTFGNGVIRVEDGDFLRPNVIVSGRLPDIVLLTTAPLRMGLPDPMDPRGRVALQRIAAGRVRLGGDPRMARGLLEMMRIEVPEGLPLDRT